MENVVVEKSAVLGGKAPGGTAGHPDPRPLGSVRRSRPTGGPVALLPLALLRRDRIRSTYPKYPTSILGGKYPITSVRDLTTGYDSTKPGNKAVLPTSKSSQMITFTFKNGLVTTLRTSGTEPKIKYYNELCASPDQKDIKQLENILSVMVTAIVQEFLQPEVNKLIPRSS